MSTLQIVGVAVARLLLAGAFLLALSLIGFSLAPRSWQPTQRRLRIPFALSAGTIGTGWAAWIAGTLLGTWAATAIAGVLFLASVPGARPWWLEIRRFFRFVIALLRRQILLSCVLGGITALIVPQLLLPVVDSDGLRYHLAFVKLYQLTGQIGFYPWDVTGGFPHTAEMLYLHVLPAGGEMAKFVHAGFFIANLILLLLLVHEGRRTRAAALLAPILFAATPVSTAPATAAFIDHIALYHAGVALLVLTRGGRTRSAAFAAGAAFATKITTAPVVLALALVATVVRRPRFKTIAFFVLLPALLFLPFAIRNVIYTGDPIYPVGRGLLRMPIEGVAESALHYATRFHQRVPGVVGIPWTYQEGIVADEVVGIHHLVGLFTLVLALRVRRTRYALAVVFAFIAIALFFRPPVRYFLPLVFSLAAFEGWALSRLRPVAATLVALVLAAPAVLFLANIEFRRAAPFDYLSGRVTRPEYLGAVVPGYRAAQIVNSIGTPGTVMALDFPSPYYFDRPWIVEGILHDPPLQQWLARGDSAEELLDRLQRLGVRLLVVTPGYGAGEPWSLLPIATTKDAALRVEAFRSALKLIHRDGEVDIYEVPLPGSPSAPGH